MPEQQKLDLIIALTRSAIRLEAKALVSQDETSRIKAVAYREIILTIKGVTQ